jgi:hypothetical protein
MQNFPSGCWLVWFCWVASWLRLGSSDQVIVTLLNTSPHSYYFQGAVATFGNQLEAEPYYDALLAIPPGDPELCEYPAVLESVNVTAIAAFRKFEPTRVALLVKRGRCSFLEKALVALEISRNSTEWTVDLVLVYNDNTTESNILFTPSSNATDAENKELQALGMVFLSTSSGNAILQQIGSLERDQNASAVLQAPGFDRWKFQIAVQQAPPDRGGPNPTAGPGSDSQSSNNSEPAFYWFRFLLFSVLILSPCLRAGYLWYAGGGRLRWRYNAHGRLIGIQYVPPIPYWYATTFTPTFRPTEVTPRLTEEEVRALPIITYQAPQRSSRHLDDEGNDVVDDEYVIEPEMNYTRADEQKDEEHGESAPFHALTGLGQAENREMIDQTQQIPPPSQYTTSCTTCSICIDDFQPGEQLRLLPLCRHAFHTDCIMPWLTERQGCCPLCKSRVLEPQSGADLDSHVQSEPPAQETASVAASPPAQSLSSAAMPLTQSLQISPLHEQSSTFPIAQPSPPQSTSSTTAAETDEAAPGHEYSVSRSSLQRRP